MIRDEGFHFGAAQGRAASGRVIASVVPTSNQRALTSWMVARGVPKVRELRSAPAQCPGDRSPAACARSGR